MILTEKSAEVNGGVKLMKELQQIPGIGPKMAATLVSLGINTIEDLRDKDPQELYERLNRISGQRQDPCVLYTFRCAVYYATEPCPDPEKLKWWNWKNG
jgi:recombinational DNA repair protein RecR